MNVNFNHIQQLFSETSVSFHKCKNVSNTAGRYLHGSREQISRIIKQGYWACERRAYIGKYAAYLLVWRKCLDSTTHKCQQALLAALATGVSAFSSVCVQTEQDINTGNDRLH